MKKNQNILITIWVAFLGTKLLDWTLEKVFNQFTNLVSQKILGIMSIKDFIDFMFYMSICYFVYLVIKYKGKTEVLEEKTQQNDEINKLLYEKSDLSIKYFRDYNKLMLRKIERKIDNEEQNKDSVLLVDNLIDKYHSKFIEIDNQIEMKLKILKKPEN